MYHFPQIQVLKYLLGFKVKISCILWNEPLYWTNKWIADFIMFHKHSLNQSFLSARIADWKWKENASESHSVVSDSAKSMEFSRPEYWDG